MKPRHGLRRFSLLLLSALIAWAGVQCLRVAAAPTLVYIGTYTGAQSHGIYVSRFDQDTGSLSAPELAATSENPAFLAVAPNQHFLYAVGEVEEFRGKPSGSVSAFRIDSASGKLTLVNEESSGGAGPCHLSVDGSGKCVLVANYGSGSIAALPIEANGALGTAAAVIQHHGSSVEPQRQSGPHAHFITADPRDRYVLACDLGLDQVLVYRFDARKPELLPNTPPGASIKAGSGPRHLAFHPNGRFIYLLSEMSSSLTVFAYDSNRGALSQLQTVSTLPESFQGQKSGAEVQVHPSGKFVYASNRGHDSISIFRIDPKTGRVTLTGQEPTGGKTPRHFAIAPSGKWLLAENQDSNRISVFAIDPATGELKPTSHSLEVGAPVCVVFVKAD